MLRSGMVVRTRDGRIVMLMGRNAGRHSWMWWGHRIKPDGNRQCLKPDTNTMPVVLAGDVVSVPLTLRTQSGAWQMIFPGIFG